MATLCLMTGRYFVIFSLYSLKLLLSFGENVFNFCHIMEMMLPDI